MEIGEFIRNFRKKKQLTLNELAKKSGVSQPYLSQLETGKNNNPTSDTLEKIAKGLDLSYLELLSLTKTIPDHDISQIDFNNPDWLKEYNGEKNRKEIQEDLQLNGKIDIEVLFVASKIKLTYLGREITEEEREKLYHIVLAFLDN